MAALSLPRDEAPAALFFRTENRNRFPPWEFHRRGTPPQSAKSSPQCDKRKLRERMCMAEYLHRGQ
jgi:hypothetical protein